MLEDLGNLFDMLDEPTNPLARLAWLEGLPAYNNAARYRLFDVAGVPFRCCYCQKNGWTSTGDEFICDHSRDEEYEYCPLPVYDAVDFGQVVRIEQV